MEGLYMLKLITNALLLLVLSSPAFAVVAGEGVIINNGKIVAAEAFFGAGEDGDFNMPTPSGGDSCDVGSECPSICDTCTARDGVNDSNGCICTFTDNLDWAGYASAPVNGWDVTMPSFKYSFTDFFLGAKNVVTIADRGDNAQTNAPNLTIRVLGDFEIEEGASGTYGDAQIDLTGLGHGSGTTASGANASAGVVGCSTWWADGGSAGAAAAGDGGNGEASDWSTWEFVVQSSGSSLSGSGAAKPTINGSTQCGQPLTRGAPTMGGAGGGGGGVNVATCTGSHDPGDAGAGLKIFVGGTMTLGDYGDIITDGADGTGTAQSGGGGGGSQLLVYREESGISSVPSNATISTSGGTGSSSTADCGAGGNGGDGAIVKVNLD